MSRSGEAIYLALWLVLPLSALLARRLPLGATIRMALVWLAIFAVLFLVVAAWQMANGAGGTLAALFAS